MNIDIKKKQENPPKDIVSERIESELAPLVKSIALDFFKSETSQKGRLLEGPFESLGQLIRAERKRQKLKTDDLAGLVGISRPTLARLEAGKTTVNIDTIAKVSRALGVSLILK